jgi:hypothetical protein
MTGYTTDMLYRRCQYSTPDDLTFVLLIHLHRLDASTEASAQQIYRLMIGEMLHCPESPDASKQVFCAVAERGGEELGCENKIKRHLMAEQGA